MENVNTDERYYDIKEVAMMSGMTDRTLRTYITMGLLRGEKVSGAWRFSAQELERFFSESWMREAMRTKRNSIVFDFLSDPSDRGERICVIVDRPSDRADNSEISSFFCQKMQEVEDAVMRCDWEKGRTRIVLSGSREAVGYIMKAYGEMEK
ncbi:MAG: helix-turn-helix domain-containing protein [Eubacteriales bacterium]|nr:helix-turn-helix domain-containing protein [Eubacteriales bacterium]